MLRIGFPARLFVSARFSALHNVLPWVGVSLLACRAAAAGQVPPEPQAAGEVTAVELDASGGLFGQGILGMVVEAGPMSWLVLAILLFFSLVSWAIILHKARRLRRAERDSAAFLKQFRSAKRLADIASWARQHPGSPVARVFNAGYQEVRYQSRHEDAEPARLSVSNMEAIARSLLRASSAEAATLEQRMMFLATTGGATPFIGLFGTVWGIMNAFQDIALTQAANISVVAPGVSEALIATAAGLGAAIPAVIAYNAFLARIRRLGSVMDDFSMEYVAMLERHLVR